VLFIPEFSVQISNYCHILFQIWKIVQWFRNSNFNSQQSYDNGQKYLGNGLYGMMSGDANADGFINSTDINQNWKPQAGAKAYLSSDFNLNGQANNQDKNDWLENNYNEFTKVPE
jgi:hypothetical protein